jgi:hypothetical protein
MQNFENLKTANGQRSTVNESESHQLIPKAVKKIFHLVAPEL